MPDYAWNIGFVVSLLFAFSSAILIGRKVFKTGVEYFSSRILIISCIINVSLCCFLFLMQAAIQLFRIITSTSFALHQIIIPIAFIAMPCKIIWNYFVIQKHMVKKFHLESDGTDDLAASLAHLCKSMGINPPVVYTSRLISSPFVFGYSSAKAILAIPANWQCVNHIQKSQRIQLLHELAHIRNHDIGFFSWSNACLRDLQILFVILPALTIYSYTIGFSYTMPSVILYFACSLILFAMFRYVIRKREMLADMTVALLIKSGNIKDVILEQEVHDAALERNSERISKPELMDKIQRWLTDKALFSNSQRFWRILLGVFSFINASHPFNAKRIHNVTAVQNDIPEQPASPLGDSFWAGVALGLLGVIIGLGGYWFAFFVQKPSDDIEVLLLPYNLYGMISMIPLIFLTIFLALPAFSSLKALTLNKRFIFSLLVRYAIVMLGACLVSSLVLIAGAANQDILVLLVVCILWIAFLVFFSFHIILVFTLIYATIRYLQSSHAPELLSSVRLFGLFIIAVFALVSAGIILIKNGMTFRGINVVCSTIAGGALIAFAVRGDRFSETDKYTIFSAFFRIHRIEGKCLSLACLVYSLYATGLLIVFASFVFFITDSVFGNSHYNLDLSLGIIIAVSICGVIILLLGRCGKNRIGEQKRTKIYHLYNSLKILSVSVDSQVRERINQVTKSYDLQVKQLKNRPVNLTMRDVYEVVSFAIDDPEQSKMLDQVLKWVLKCQTPGGFGIWPTSSPRLYSTYQAISVLRDTALFDKCNRQSHSHWIRSLQQPDGSFRDFRSKRDPWQDTFYAVKSLDMLGLPLEKRDASKCENWCRNILISEGLKKDRFDVTYYSLAILTTLGKVDGDISKFVLERMSSSIEELLLTNISLDYENVHYGIMINNLLPHSVISTESLTLLADRIKMTVNAELANIKFVNA